MTGMRSGMQAANRSRGRRGRETICDEGAAIDTRTAHGTIKGVKPLIVLLLLAPGLGAIAQEPVTSRTDAVGKALNQWAAENTAAGFQALRYENRDGGHSLLPADLYPKLGILAPTEEDKKTGRDKGPAFILRPFATIGNCSMAGVGNGIGSLARAMFVQERGQIFLFNQYLHNNLIIYPEHQDYHPGANGVGGGWGDLFPANSASTLASYGSSYRDMPFVKAFLATAAAFKPEIQDMLIRKRILMPTLQAIFRQSNKQVLTEEDYFTGKAHPPVFDGAQIDELKMVTVAQTLTPLAVPPLAFFEVVSERPAIAGRDFFERPSFTHEKLGDTPVNVARLYRGSSETYTMTLDARRSVDTQQRPLHYRWSILQGRTDLIKIETTDEGRQATLHVRWHPPMVTTSGIRTHRVDIGLFVTNGIGTSVPAIVSFYMLPNERRFFDAQGRRTEICYEAGNPELGLPLTASDTRWLAFAQAAGANSDTVTFRLVNSALSPAQRAEWGRAWLALHSQKAALDQTASAPDSKEKSDQAAALGRAIAKALPAALRESAGAAINAIADRSDTFIAHQSDILKLAAKSPKAGALADLRAELKRLTSWGVLVEQENGAFATAHPPGVLTAADRYYLRQLHLTVLSQILLPGFLERSPAPLFVDPRLTTPKSWRDVYRYDEQGGLTGWTRHSEGRMQRFDVAGRLLDGRDKPLPVTYREAAGHLIFEVVGTKN